MGGSPHSGDARVAAHEPDQDPFHRWGEAQAPGDDLIQTRCSEPGAARHNQMGDFAQITQAADSLEREFRCLAGIDCHTVGGRWRFGRVVEAAFFAVGVGIRKNREAPLNSRALHHPLQQAGFTTAL